MNKIIILGRLTKDPERVELNNYDLARFSIACRGKRKDENGDIQTDFFNCLAWGKKADTICEHCVKGDLVQVSGNISSRRYESQQKGEIVLWEVTVDDIEFISSPKDKVDEDDIPPRPVRPSKQEPKQVKLEDETEELPF